MTAIFDNPHKFKRLQVRPMNSTIGAEIRGVDLSRPLDDETWQEVRQAFADYLVVYFPEQPLTHDQHLAFSERLGPLMAMPQLLSVEGHEAIHIIKRDADDNSRVIGESWHADSTYFEAPPAAVVMRAVTVPEFGGDTGFPQHVHRLRDPVAQVAFDPRHPERGAQRDPHLRLGLPRAEEKVQRQERAGRPRHRGRRPRADPPPRCAPTRCRAGASSTSTRSTCNASKA